MPKAAEDIDALISARVPVVEPDCHCAACASGEGRCIQVRKREAAMKHMMHKCAVGVCMSREEPRVCRRGFPKAPSAMAGQDDGGYPIYRRGPADSMVVAHNVLMLLKYDCHINVELCSSSWVHKYMVRSHGRSHTGRCICSHTYSFPPFKQHTYMHKGPDKVRMITKDIYSRLKASGMNMQDEVLKLQVFRYLSAGEALCRLFGYHLSQSSVGCTRLSVHLEGMDWVGEDAGAAAGPSSLLQYFSRPPAAEAMKYLQYFSAFNVVKASAEELRAGADLQRVAPKSRRSVGYTLDALGSKVSERKPGSLHVARMYPVSVTQGEVYYLRALLAVVPARSFEGMRTVDGTVYPTYREAAEARGLLAVEREFAQALGCIAKGLGEGVSTIADIRHTFSMIAVSGGEGVPVLDLYNSFKYTMALDIDASGALSPPGMDKGPLNVRLPVWRYVEDEEPPSLDDYPVHEYHLLRILEGLLERNYQRTLQDLGLPTPQAHAAARIQGAAEPYMQLVLESYLYARAGQAVPAGQQAHLERLRAIYADKYPQLLTGECLQELAVAQQQRGYEATFFSGIDRFEEGQLFDAMYETLNGEQKVFVDKCCRALQHQVARKEALKQDLPEPSIPDEERFLHLQARGGRGKSYVTKCILAKALHLGIIESVSSFAGIAAILLPMGRTCHQTYGLMLDTSAPGHSTLTTRSAQGKHLGECFFHVIDEVECLHQHLFNAASEVTTRCVNARWGTSTDLPFGGSMVLILGDMHQGLPISKGIVNDDVTISSMVRASPIFARFHTSILTEAQRSKNDPQFDNWLGLLSTNHAPGPVPVDDQPPPTVRKVYVPEQCFKTTSLDLALEWLFGAPPPVAGPFPELNPRHALLTTLNTVVDEVNDVVLDRYVEGEAITLEAAHEACRDAEANDGISRIHATLEYMRAVKQTGVPNSTLRLKPGCIMLLTRNMLSSLGLVNGTRLRLLSQRPARGDALNVLHVETVLPPGSTEAPSRHFIPRICFELFTPGGLKFYRRQFPVRLAYAITGQKSQGQTVVRAVFDSRLEAFSHGVAYVCASRTTGFNSMGFLHAECEGPRPTFHNFVLQRALEPGVLRACGRPLGIQRGPIALGDEQVDEEEEEEEGEAAEVPAPRRVFASAPARKQKGGMSLMNRRTVMHTQVLARAVRSAPGAGAESESE